MSAWLAAMQRRCLSSIVGSRRTSARRSPDRAVTVAHRARVDLRRGSGLTTPCAARACGPRYVPPSMSSPESTSRLAPVAPLAPAETLVLTTRPETAPLAPRGEARGGTQAHIPGAPANATAGGDTVLDAPAVRIERFKAVNEHGATAFEVFTPRRVEPGDRAQASTGTVVRPSMAPPPSTATPHGVAPVVASAPPPPATDVLVTVPRWLLVALAAAVCALALALAALAFVVVRG